MALSAHHLVLALLALHGWRGACLSCRSSRAPGEGPLQGAQHNGHEVGRLVLALHAPKDSGACTCARVCVSVHFTVLLSEYGVATRCEAFKRRSVCWRFQDVSACQNRSRERCTQLPRLVTPAGCEGKHRVLLKERAVVSLVDLALPHADHLVRVRSDPGKVEVHAFAPQLFEVLLASFAFRISTRIRVLQRSVKRPMSGRIAEVNAELRSCGMIPLRQLSACRPRQEQC